MRGPSRWHPGLQSSEGLTTSKGTCVAAGPSSSPCGAPMGLLRDGRRREQPSRSYRVFHTLILGVTCHHFCPSLLVVQTYPGTGRWRPHKCENQNSGTSRGHLGAWFSQGVTWKVLFPFGELVTVVSFWNQNLDNSKCKWYQ